MRRLSVLLLLVFIGGTSFYYFLPEKKLPPNTVITEIRVLKSKRKMLVFSGNQLLKTYPISLGLMPIGKKLKEGDCKTPEGNYLICSKNPNSVCYKNLGISYPNTDDLLHSPVIAKAGGDIKIHGLPNHQSFWGKLHRLKDWTNGCIAVTNEEMDELYAATPIGIPIIIMP